MPARPPTFALYPKPRPTYDNRRGTAVERGYDSRWRKARALFLRKPENRYCVYCARRGVKKFAECIDHVVAHKGDKVKFWEVDNWAASCVACNSRKAAMEEGGFGRTK